MEGSLKDALELLHKYSGTVLQFLDNIEQIEKAGAERKAIMVCFSSLLCSFSLSSADMFRFSQTQAPRPKKQESVCLFLVLTALLFGRSFWSEP